jgi:hypothetical protein
VIIKQAIGVLALTLGLALVSDSRARAQEAGKPKDDALDSLLEKLSGSADGSASKAESAGKRRADAPEKKAGQPGRGDSGGVEEPPAPSSGTDRKGPPPAGGGRAASQPGPARARDGQAAATQSKPKPGGAATVSEKDQALDELLQKLGETKDTPAPDDRPRQGPGPGEDQKEKSRPPARADQPDRAKVGAKDKEIDDRLEELTGRRKRRNPDDQQRSGPVGQIIKEMREVEQKLGKPDTGEGTRDQQKQIVKRIETLIQEMQRSGSSMRMMVRRVRRPGQQPGQQPGSTTGALARGAPPMKPAKPTGRRSNAGGKEIWGHLPAELRAEIDNQVNEEPLTSKQDLIERYYLSVGKGKLVREE